MMIQGFYGMLRNLPLRKRTRMFERLQKLGIEQRLQAQGTTVYEHDGCRIGVDLNDHVGREMFKHGWYESLYVDFIRGCLTDSEGVLFDVGANVGNYSLALAPYFYQTLAFEPNPHVYESLVANCRRNPSRTIRPMRVGLSSRNETLTFYPQTRGNSGQSSFESGPAGTAGPSLRMRVTTGDACAVPGRRVALVKIDVEGHELEVLRGLASVLRCDRPAVCLEWHTQLMQARGGVATLRSLLPDDYVIVHSARRDRIDLKPLLPPYRDKYNLIFCVEASRLHGLEQCAGVAPKV